MIFTKIRLLIVVVSVVGVVGALSASYFYGHKYGRLLCEKAQADQLLEARQQQQLIAERLEAVERDREKLLQQQVKNVQKATDDSGCADAPVPLGVRNALDALRD